MINPFKWKKYIALIILAMLTPLGWVLAGYKWGILGSIGGLFLGLAIGLFTATLMLKNPFSDMLEGKGILALNLDSTGIITPFIMKVKSPYVSGKLKGSHVTDVFDRDAVMQLSTPINSPNPAVIKDDKTITIVLNEEAYNKARFALYTYPTIIYNEQIKSVLTKDFLGDKEKDSFAEHGVLYLNRKMEELTSSIRDFGRYVVETLKPKTSLFASKWVWIIIIIIVGVLIAMFAPAIMSAIKGSMSKGAEVLPQGITPLK